VTTRAEEFADEHDHGPAAQLLDQVWCRTCHHTHIGTIPTHTFRCADCGFGCWGPTVAEAHATMDPDHIVHAVHHQTVSIEEGCPAAT
jgi:hypothetical protein